MTAQQLKNSILQMAVQGKLVPQDPNDEPARVLLDRIRTEKEKLIKEGKIKKEKNPSVIFRGEDNLPYEKVGKKEPVCIADEVPCDIPDTWEWTRLSVANEMYTGNSINENEKKAKYMGLHEGRFYIGTKDVSFSHDIDYDNGVRILMTTINLGSHRKIASLCVSRVVVRGVRLHLLIRMYVLVINCAVLYLME